MRGTRALTLVAVATVVALAGCGSSSKQSGSDTSSSTAEPAAQTTPAGRPLTQADLIAKGDAICYRINAWRISHFVRSRRDFERLLPQVAAYERKTAAEFETLVPPAAVAADWKLIVADEQAIADETLRVSRYTTAGNRAATTSHVASLKQFQEELLGVARRIGFKDCAKI